MIGGWAASANRRWHAGIDVVRRRPVRFAFVMVGVVVTIVFASFSWAQHTTADATRSNRAAIQENHRLAVQNRRLAVQGVQARDAICALKESLAERVRESEDFLKHPTDIGFPITPAFLAAIKTSTANQRVTLDALKASGLECPATKPSRKKPGT